MKVSVYRKRNALATAIAVALTAAIGTAIAESGNLSSANTDVNKVFGRASASPASGQTIRTSGLSNETLGRSTAHGDHALSQVVASRPVDGALQWAGRGSQPRYTFDSRQAARAKVAKQQTR